MFLEFCSLEPDDFVKLVRKNPRKAEDLVTSYILKRKGKVSGSTIHNFRMALKLLLSMNDCDKLNWVRIGKIMSPTRKHGSDKAPTADNLRKTMTKDLENGETNFMSISKADERGIFKQTLTFPHDERIVQEVIDALQSVA